MKIGWEKSLFILWFNFFTAAVWYPRDEADNFSQKHDSELIKEEKRLEVETEIRLQVDELMRAELKNLKMVNDIYPLVKVQHTGMVSEIVNDSGPAFSGQNLRSATFRNSVEKTSSSGYK